MWKRRLKSKHSQSEPPWQQAWALNQGRCQGGRNMEPGVRSRGGDAQQARCTPPHPTPVGKSPPPPTFPKILAEYDGGSTPESSPRGYASICPGDMMLLANDVDSCTTQHAPRPHRRALSCHTPFDVCPLQRPRGPRLSLTLRALAPCSSGYLFSDHIPFPSCLHTAFTLKPAPALALRASRSFFPSCGG